MKKNKTLDDPFLEIMQEIDPNVMEEITTTGFIDSGSYAFNALLSGSIFGGFPNNRVVALAGEQATGKSFFAMGLSKEFQQSKEDSRILYFDTEFALDKSFFENRGLDAEKVYISQPETLEEFRTKSVNILDKFAEMKKRPELMIVLDSLGNLPSKKEMEDAASGSDKRDMTKAGTIKSIFRVLTQKIGKLNVPMIVTNHVYDVVGAYIPTKAMSGGSGLKYAASTIIYLSKKKDRDGNDVIGNIIVAKTEKSRFTKSDQKVELKLNFDTGLDRYYGLLPLAEAAGIIKKVSTRYELPDGTKIFEKAINRNPEKVFTQDILLQIDEYCKRRFGLGTGNDEVEELEVEDNEDGEEEIVEINSEE